MKITIDFEKAEISRLVCFLEYALRKIEINHEDKCNLQNTLEKLLEYGLIAGAEAITEGTHATQ